MNPTQSSGSPARVLIVEDESLIGEEMAELLSHNGYVAAHANSLAEAVAYLGSNPNTDVVISDIVMPEGDGFALLEHIRARDKSRPAVILVTGRASVGSVSEAMRHGAFDYLEKPIHLDQLLDSVSGAAAYVRAQARFSEERSEVETKLANLYSLVIDLHSKASISLGVEAPEVSVVPLRDAEATALILKQINILKRLDKLRSKLFPTIEFSDPYWEILLLLLETELMKQQIAISGVCYSISGSNSAALRRIYDLEEQNMIHRSPDENDRRRVYLKLAPQASEALWKFFAASP
jgi:DNA-binding response OmpR family regulator/DNA-binding MarR family transcriptional regulator